MIKAMRISKSFETPVLKGMDLAVNEGEVVVIMGQSGSGKTTLLRILCGLEKCDSGTVSFDGKPLSADVETRRKMAIVFQKPLAFNMSVYDNVAYGLRLRKVPEELVDRKVRSVLGFVGLPKSLYSKSALRLSGGEMQRVALARSIVVEPKLLLLDEPTANLDDVNTERFEKLLLKASREKKISVVLTTHSMAQAARLSKNILLLEDGKLRLKK